MGDLVPNLWDQLDFSSPKSNYDMMQEFNSQLKRQVTSRNVQFTVIHRTLNCLESILKGCELRFGHLEVHRMSLGCFESDSKNIFESLVIKAIRE